MPEHENTQKTGNALRLGESLRYILRGFREIHRIDTQLIPLSAVTAFLQAAVPLVTLYLSARLLNLLGDGGQLQQVLLYAGAAVGIAFALAALRAWVERKVETRRESVWLRFYAHLARRYARLDYRQVEDTGVSELLADIQSKTNGNGLGLMRQIWTMNELMTSASPFSAR